MYGANEWNFVRLIYVLVYSPAASIQINIFTINQITELTSNFQYYLYIVCIVGNRET